MQTNDCVVYVHRLRYSRREAKEKGKVVNEEDDVSLVTFLTRNFVYKVVLACYVIIYILYGQTYQYSPRNRLQILLTWTFLTFDEAFTYPLIQYSEVLTPCSLIKFGIHLGQLYTMSCSFKG